MPQEPICVPIGTEISFIYTNWQGRTEKRRVKVLGLYYGCNEWHIDPTLFLYGYDLSRNVYRYFAVVEIDASTIAKG